MKSKKETIRFQSKTQSTKGIIALILACFVLLFTAVLIYLSAKGGGESGLWIGLFAFVFMLIALIGFVFALRALYERDVMSALPITALLLNGFCVILYLCFYFIGV